MKTKNLLTVVFITLLSTTTLLAQNQHPKGKKEHKFDKEKFQTMKIAYLTEKLSLTSAEAEKFWPVYNEYSDKKASLFKEMRKGKKENAEEIEMTDEEIEKAINQRIENKQKELDLEKQYLGKFKDVLPIKKVGQLYKAEDNFKKDLLRKMRDDSPRFTKPETPSTPPSPNK